MDSDGHYRGHHALLERKGADTVLVTTAGFPDLLEIGNQDRPEIFDLEIRKPALLYKTVIEVDERVRLKRPDDDSSDALLADIMTGINGEKFVVLKKPDPEEIYRRRITVFFQK